MRFLALALGLAGCGPATAIEWGKESFSDRGLSTAASNSFSCATCHDLTPTQALRAGYPLADVSLRPTFWGGNVVTMQDAVNQCLVDFMKSKPLSPTDDRGKALFIYLSSLVTSDGSLAGAQPLTIVQNIVDLPSGDVSRGAALFANGCANCHGAVKTGAGRIGSDSSILPDDTINTFGTDPVRGARVVTVEKIRHGKFFNIGGVMAPYGLERCSDAQASDILAYMETAGLPKQP